MNPLSTYLKLGTGTATDPKRVATIRLFNVLALIGSILHLIYFFMLVFLGQATTGIVNLVFIVWFSFVPVLNYLNHHKAAIITGNLAFAPMALSLAFIYGGTLHVEDFIFIGLVLTFFSFVNVRKQIFFTVFNLTSYVLITIFRHKELFTPPSETLMRYELLFRMSDLIVVLGTFSIVLYAVNKLYRKQEEALEANARILRQNSLKVEELLAEAKQANDTKLKLLKVISHDLRAPFTGLLGLTELMEKQYESYSKVEMKEMLRLLSDSSKNTLVLIENLVQWSKLHSETLRMDRKNLFLNSIVKQNINIYSTMALQKQLTIVNEIDTFQMVNADENMLMLIIRNLLNNAIKYTHEEGEIRLSAVPKRRYVTITIADTGVGMTPEQINSVLHNNRSTSQDGTLGEKGSGLGLILCKEFVEKHNCRMTITSTPGKFTSISFTMPVAKPEETPAI